MSDAQYLPGRLGLAGGRIPHADRHGLLWLTYGNLFVEDGTLRFVCAESHDLAAGDYSIPFQGISLILLGPGTSVTHDVLRLLARHGTLLAAIGAGGTKFYSAPPIGQGRSDVARRHAEIWNNIDEREDIVRKMYALRFGQILPHSDLHALRGIEGSRMKKLYSMEAQRHGIQWKGRHYDRSNPNCADKPNQAINHMATFVEAAADVACAAVGALPPLGFIHEDSSNAFILDIADLYRGEITIPVAFRIAKRAEKQPNLELERELRKEAVEEFRKQHLVSKMIERIKVLLHVDDRNSNT